MQAKYRYFLSIAWLLWVGCGNEPRLGSVSSSTGTASGHVEMAPAAPPPAGSSSKMALDSKQKPAADAAAAAANEEGTKPAAEKIEVVERKVIKTGDIEFETKDLNKTKNLIAKTVSDLKGYVAEESQHNSDYRKQHTITIRVPALQFDTLLSILGTHAGHFDSKNIHTQDVTEEYIDVSARLKTQRNLEIQYVQVLKQAKNVKEIMEVQGFIADVREKIESAEGRLRYLSNQVGLSTLTISFYTTTGVSGHPKGFFWRLTHEFGNGWEGLLNLVVGVVSIWPFWLLVFGAIWGFRRWKKGGNIFRFWKK
jgi:hypothetical protein